MIGTADVIPGRMLVEQAKHVSKSTYEERISRLRPQPGDIFYSREGARFGIAAPVPENVEVCLGQRMMHFRASADTDASYLLWLLNSPIVRQQAITNIIGSASPHVNIGQIKQFKVLCPPLPHQRLLGKLSRDISESEGLLHSYLKTLHSFIVSFSERLFA